MRAMMVRENSLDMSVMQLEDVNLPPPGEKEVRVRIRAASTQFPDILMIQKKYQYQPPLPYIPGTEFAGDVVALGAGVTQWKIGDAVVAGMLSGGGFAEEVNAHEGALRRKPSPLSYGQACSFRSAYLTAQVSLIRRGELQPGETLLVLGAAGGVGLAAVELGKAMGARVIAAASTDDKLAVCKAHGADEGINYDKEDLKERIKALTGGKGADVIYDPVGGDYSEAALRAINWNGRFLVVGFANGEIPKIPLNLTLLKGCQIVGVFWGASIDRDIGHFQKRNQELLDYYVAGKLKPLVTGKYPLEEVAAALNLLAARKVTGKLVLTTGRS